MLLSHFLKVVEMNKILFIASCINELEIRIKTWVVIYMYFFYKVHLLTVFRCYSEDKIDHHSYPQSHNLSSCEIKAWKKLRPQSELEPMTWQNNAFQVVFYSLIFSCIT